jgi:Flp pilus assembly protein TadB
MSVLVGLLGAVAVVAAAGRLLPSPSRGRRSRPWRRRARYAGAGAAAVVAVALWPPALLGLIVWWVSAPWARRRRDRARVERTVARALPEVTEAVVLAVRAGCTPYQALEVLAPVLGEPFGPAFAEVLDRHRGGARLAVALEALPARAGERARLLARALAADDGLALGPRLDALAADARADRRRAAESAARRLPVTLAVPLVVCILPAFVLVTVVPLLVSALGRLSF